MRETDSHIYFFTHTDPFSNMYPIQFEYVRHTGGLFGVDDIFKVHSSEQAYMLEKAYMFKDTEKVIEIKKSITGTEAKKIASTIKKFDKNIWNSHKYDIMYDICLQKFAKNKPLLNILHKTGNKILVEASPYDKYWGVGISKHDDNILIEKNWLGLNKLGEILMDIRRNTI